MYLSEITFTRYREIKLSDRFCQTNTSRKLYEKMVTQTDPTLSYFVWFFPGALSPPACFNSEFGCCWDYVTSALGPGGKGCPPCDDNRRYPNVCQRFRTYCRRKGISGRWMRGNCPYACGHCGTFMDS